MIKLFSEFQIFTFLLKHSKQKKLCQMSAHISWVEASILSFNAHEKQAFEFYDL